MLWVGKLLQHLLSAGQPAGGLDGNESWWIIRGLKEVVGFDVSREVLYNHLGILATRLQAINISMESTNISYATPSLPKRSLYPIFQPIGLRRM